MSASVLITDTSVPFAVSLAEMLRGKDIPVGLLSEPTSDQNAVLAWNRSSPLSARTVMLEMKNLFDTFDRSLFVFDTPTFSGLLPESDPTTPLRCVDEYVRGYVLLAREISQAFRRQKNGLMAFALRCAAAPSTGTNLPLAVAEGAFARLAEETASLAAAHPDDGLRCLLVRLDPADDADSLGWVSEQLLNPAPSRGHVRWVKAGSRGLFGRF